MDYCDTVAEKTKNPIAKDLMLMIAKGNAAAYQWMWDFWCFTHAIDDLVDKDTPSEPDRFSKALAGFVTALSVNPFYQANVYQLYPLIISACNRWIDGDRLKHSDNERDKIYSEVVRCGDVDLYIYIAFLIGGWDHMRMCSEKSRLYDKVEV